MIVLLFSDFDGRSTNLPVSAKYRGLGDSNGAQPSTPNALSPEKGVLGARSGGQLIRGSLPREEELGDGGGDQLSTEAQFSREEALGDGSGQRSSVSKISPTEGSLDDRSAGEVSTSNTFPLAVRSDGGDITGLSLWTQWGKIVEHFSNLWDKLVRIVLRAVASYVGRIAMRGILDTVFFILNSLADLFLPLFGQGEALKGDGTVALLREAVRLVKAFQLPVSRSLLSEVTSSADYSAFYELRDYLAAHLTGGVYVGFAKGLFNFLSFPTPDPDAMKAVNFAMSSLPPSTATSFLRTWILVPPNFVRPFQYLANTYYSEGSEGEA